MHGVHLGLCNKCRAQYTGSGVQQQPPQMHSEFSLIFVLMLPDDAAQIQFNLQARTAGTAVSQNHPSKHEHGDLSDAAALLNANRRIHSEESCFL